jgi:hypothetical protein
VTKGNAKKSGDARFIGNVKETPIGFQTDKFEEIIEWRGKEHVSAAQAIQPTCPPSA